MSVFDALAAGKNAPFEHGRTLPIEAYRSQELLHAELTELFGNDWLCVGRTADVASPGDYLTAELPTAAGGNRSIIVLRADDGEVRAFENVCIHRGAQLLEGCGTETRITCPYHAWVYRLDGSLVGAPFMAESIESDGTPFDPGRHHLVGLTTEVWEGFIFASQSSAAAPLAPKLDGLTDVVGRYEMANYTPVHEQVDVWDTNWKLLVENFMDAYHIFKVHKDSFGAAGDNTAGTTMYPGTTDWAHHRVLEPGADLAAAQNQHLDGAWRKTIVLAAVFPGFVIQLQPDWLWFLRITPLDTKQVRIAWQVAVAPETLAAQTSPERYVDEVMALIHQVNSEDHPIVEGLRAAAHRPQFSGAPLSYLERNVWDFDQYIRTRLT